MPLSTGRSKHKFDGEKHHLMAVRILLNLDQPNENPPNYQTDEEKQHD